MGRSAILMVISFSMMFILFGANMFNVKLDAIKNAVKYYENVQRDNIATAGANFACSALYKDTSWRAGYSNVAFNGGRFSVYVTDTLITYANQLITKTRKVTVIGSHWNGLLRNADGTEGRDSSQLITILLQPSNFAKFAYYSNNDPSTIVWATGDSVYGPYHSNTKLYVSGSPVFWGKVSTLNGVSPATNSAKFKGGGPENGINIPIPATSITPIIDSARARGFYRYSTTDDTAWVTFLANGKVYTKIGRFNTLDTTRLLDTLTKNGAIVFRGYILRLKGKMTGRATICSFMDTSASPSGGVIYIDSSLVYVTPPTVANPNPIDMLGILATKQIWITDNTNNRTAGGVDLHGTLFSMTQGMGVENYATRPEATLRTLGGLSQNVRLAVAQTGSPFHGFHKSYHYDLRLASTFPPFFPLTGRYEIVSWFE
jgi:hypothetical protein